MSRLGAIADDFTGATDLAANLSARGFQVVVVPGSALDAVRSKGLQELSHYEAVVVALKTRTAPVDEAVEDSRRALTFLRDLGCTRFFDKYCSTFDSTDEGNIGPILDLLSTELQADTTVVVPSFPANGRVVKDGYLYVNGDLLEHSSMRHHPLTPMTRSRLVDLLRPQTETRVSEVHQEVVDSGAESLRGALTSSQRQYVVVDAETDADLAVIAAATAGHTLVSGGSGLALGMSPRAEGDAAPMAITTGRRLVLSGSASSATRAQVQHATSLMPSLKINLVGLAADPETALDRTLAWLRDSPTDEPAIIYAVDSLDDLVSNTSTSAQIEWLIAEVAVAASTEAYGFSRVIVAGGETSGAVVQALGLDRLVIGPEIAPGVCWASGDTAARSSINLALKSGNFGAPDMFSSAWEVLAR